MPLHGTRIKLKETNYIRVSFVALLEFDHGYKIKRRKLAFNFGSITALFIFR